MVSTNLVLIHQLGSPKATALDIPGGTRCSRRCRDLKRTPSITLGDLRLSARLLVSASSAVNFSVEAALPSPARVSSDLIPPTRRTRQRPVFTENSWAWWRGVQSDSRPDRPPPAVRVCARHVTAACPPRSRTHRRRLPLLLPKPRSSLLYVQLSWPASSVELRPLFFRLFSDMETSLDLDR